MECKQHEIQHLLFTLDQLGKSFGTNIDLYYTLGQYLGYMDIFLSAIESQKNPLAWILCSTCINTHNIASFISILKHCFLTMVILIDLDILLVAMDSLLY